LSVFFLLSGFIAPLLSSFHVSRSIA
jgi:hypothetical protein